MTKKKNGYVYKRREKPDIIEVLDTKLLRDYIWQRGSASIPVKVWRYIGLGMLKDYSNPKAYWYIVEQIKDGEHGYTNTYGFFRRPEWDR